MRSKKLILKPSQDGTELCIVFKDGKESIFFAFRLEILEVLEVLRKTNRISKEEEVELLLEVIDLKKFPLFDRPPFPTSTEEMEMLFSLLGFVAAITKDALCQNERGILSHRSRGGESAA